MNDQIANIFILFLYVLIFAIIIRSLLTWFPVDRNNEMVRLLNTITEPLLEPVRRVMPRTGMIFSAMVVIVVLYVMISVVRRAAGQ